MNSPYSAPIFQCPLTRQPLHLLSSTELAALMTRTKAGTVIHRDGSAIHSDVDAVLATADQSIFYPITAGIAVLLPSLAWITTDAATKLPTETEAPDTAAVRRFYDEIGWTGDASGTFEDARRWEDLRPVSADYIARCHARVSRHLPAKGRYLLDIASGPIQYDAYLPYSAGMEQRICADISSTALRAAKIKLGDQGLYVQCDITRLPFRNGCLDGFVSLHTVYHVPADRQLLAFRELERVTQPGGSGAVIYSWGSHAGLVALLENFSWKELLKRCLPSAMVRALSQAPSPSVDKPQGLYFSPHDYRWFQREVALNGKWVLKVWRAASVPMLQRYIGETAGGRALLKLLYRIEESCPRLCGRYGLYPMLVFRQGETK